MYTSCDGNIFQRCIKCKYITANKHNRQYRYCESRLNDKSRPILRFERSWKAYFFDGNAESCYILIIYLPDALSSMVLIKFRYISNIYSHVHIYTRAATQTCSSMHMMHPVFLRSDDSGEPGMADTSSASEPVPISGKHFPSVLSRQTAYQSRSRNFK